ncbi:putative O-methylsterigmatocystin oxidoreductase [Bombardia bombarda]|uniref:O-methylsterigmatocystin oxidoreductase n=1 Tax=Bombardia bombarda TaxID=252184 RepID=A0AA40C929_9PEZI|nr:putative O-methylsterigmatocystin oxidoreductase [Bombardia bombarda]
MGILVLTDLSLGLSTSAMAALIAIVGAVATLLAIYRAFRRAKQTKRFPLPPGPPGEFLLGHYRTVPEDAAFMKYAEWAKEYQTDVLYFETFGTRWIVLNTLAAAEDLLEKRGAKYADRPRFVMFEEMGWSPTLTWLRWGPKYHLHRRILQPSFSKSKVVQYMPMQRKEALVCCKSMTADPGSWTNSTRRFAVAIVLNIAYGLDVDGPSSPWIKLADDASNAISKSGAPASSIMDRIPATRYLPDWLPFMERLRYAHTWRHAIESITKRPFEASLKRMDEPKRLHEARDFTSIRMAIHTSNHIEGTSDEFGINDIKGAAATILIAGNDTTGATAMILVLYLMQNPVVQRRAQDEVDRVIGGKSQRLPTWEDVPKLTYVNAVLQETYRMNPLSPLGIPHASIVDDVYNGMFIPKGTIVYPNVWAMLHDERVYSDPFEFRPERFLSVKDGGRGEPLPVGNFGFGRRICIGRNLAENSLLIFLATLLATVDIDWPPGPDGKPTPFEPEWSFKGAAIVLPFKASISRRSSRTTELLEAELESLQEGDS